MSNVSIKISSKWLNFVHSPLMWIVWTLQGISISVASLWLYWIGKGKFSPGTE